MILAFVCEWIIGASPQDNRSTEPLATMKLQAHDQVRRHKQCAIRIYELAGRIQLEADASAFGSAIAGLFVSFLIRARLEAPVFA